LEFAATLSPKDKVRGGMTKRILKDAFKGDIPPQIINRRKTGLPVPLRRWMRNDLGQYIRETLLNSEAKSLAYLNREAVEDLLNANAVDGKLMKEVFSLLTLELWFAQFKKGKTLSQPTR
jgi:asparagine synthase (glutamine-hydrolysing)